MFEESKGSLKKGTLLNSSYKSKDYVDWNETEVCEWLANDVNFPLYCEKFSKHSIFTCLKNLNL